MKKLLFLCPLLVMMLAVSCGGKNSGAEDVAGKFVKLFFVDVDIAGSRQFVSEELKDEFSDPEQMSQLEKHFVQILKDHAAAHGYKAEYDAERSGVAESTADIYYNLTAKGNPDWTGTGEVELQKDADGKWIVTDYEFDRDEDAIDFGF